MNNKILAMISCRVSSEEQLKNNSLNRQWDAVVRAAEQLNAIIPKDARWSGVVSSKRGNNVNRKDIKEMLEYARKNKNVKYLIIDEPDRFMRSIDEAMYFEMVFKLQGVRIWYACDPELNKNDMAAKIQRFMKYWVAEGSNEERIRKSISGGKKAIQEGRYPSHPKLGYRKGDRPGVHLIDPEPAEIVKSILVRLANGLLDLSESLAEYNNSTFVTSGKRSHHKLDRWREIVGDPYYAGIVEIKEQINERNEKGLHEPLITREQHLKIREILDGRKKSHAAPSKGGNPKFPLNTILLCEKCWHEQLAIGREGRKNRGKFVGGSSNNGRTLKHYPKYWCRNKCGLLIGRDEAHCQIANHLNSLDLTDEGRRKLTNALGKVWGAEEKNSASEVIRLRNQIINIRKVKDELLDSIGNFSSPMVLAEIEKKIEQRANEIERTEAKIREIERNVNGDRDKFMTFALNFADNLGNNFFGLTPDNVKKCKLLLFPSGFFVNRDKKVYIPEISPFYRYREKKNEPKVAQKSDMVAGAGFEPATFWL